MERCSNGLTGGCACGAIRYLVTEQPFHRTVCHCTTCRRVSGSPVVAWFTVPPMAFQILSGVPKVFRSSTHASRSFCGGCGTQLTFAEDGLGEIDVTVCSLDDPTLVPPDDQTYVQSAIPWLSTMLRLPAHNTLRQQSG